MNAALDTLWQPGVRRVDMPATPQRVWSWLHEADANGGAMQAAE